MRGEGTAGGGGEGGRRGGDGHVWQRKSKFINNTRDPAQQPSTVEEETVGLF
jgi:hypothetical protein